MQLLGWPAPDSMRFSSVSVDFAERAKLGPALGKAVAQSAARARVAILVFD